MSGRLEIAFANAEGAVLRVLGLIERRGFKLRNITMAEGGQQSSLSVEVRGRFPERSLDVLAAQLGRLDEVSLVSFSTSAPSASS
jgi:acetolactate synthase regulatory subunit